MDETGQAPEEKAPEMALAVADGQAFQIRIPCGAAGPLVINGGGFAGCQEDRGHFPATPHKIVIVWQ